MNKPNTSNKVDNHIVAVVGSRRTGITTENKKHINRYVKDRKQRGKDYRVLVVDFEGEYKGTKIEISELRTFKNKVAVIGDAAMTQEQKIQLIETINYNYKNGLLVIDKLYKFVSEKKFRELSERIVSFPRTRALDIIIDFPTFSCIPTKVFQNIDYIRLHNTYENIMRPAIRNRLYNPILCQFAIAIRNVKFGISLAPRINYEFVVIDCVNEEIFGCTASEYLKGAKEFVGGRIKTAKTIKQVEAFCGECFIIKTSFSDKKHIPLSNIERPYIKN